MKELNVKGIIFDFGGTLDTDGDHWGEVLWDVYRDFDLPVTKEDFRKAYVQGERTLAVCPLIMPGFHFVDVLRAKLNIQLEYLCDCGLWSVSMEEKEVLLSEMLEKIDKRTRAVWANSACILGELKKRYPLVLVSNFYGNIHTVLEEASLLPFFEQVIESAVVGVRKPDSAIFSLGVQALGLQAEQVAVVGDSLSKDMKPASRLGCRTIWLKGRQWEQQACDCDLCPDIIIRELAEIQRYL